MAPILVEDPERLERLKRARQSAEFFQHHLEELQDLDVRYVILLGDSIIGRGDSPEEAWNSVPEGDAPEEGGAVLMPVPQEDETFLF